MTQQNTNTQPMIPFFTREERASLIDLAINYGYLPTDVNRELYETGAHGKIDKLFRTLRDLIVGQVYVQFDCLPIDVKNPKFTADEKEHLSDMVANDDGFMDMITNAIPIKREKVSEYETEIDGEPTTVPVYALVDIDGKDDDLLKSLGLAFRAWKLWLAEETMSKLGNPWINSEDEWTWRPTANAYLWSQLKSLFGCEDDEKDAWICGRPDMRSLLVKLVGSTLILKHGQGDEYYGFREGLKQAHRGIKPATKPAARRTGTTG